MKLITTILSILFIIGCSIKDRKYRLIYIEKEKKLISLKDRSPCIMSGMDIDPKVYKGKGYPDTIILEITYKNCEVKQLIELDEREKLQWGIPIRQLKKK